MARVAHKMSTTRHRNQTPAISQARSPYRKWRCELSRSSHSSQLPNDRLWKLRKVKPSAKENIVCLATGQSCCGRRASPAHFLSLATRFRSLQGELAYAAADWAAAASL